MIHIILPLFARFFIYAVGKLLTDRINFLLICIPSSLFSSFEVFFHIKCMIFPEIIGGLIKIYVSRVCIDKFQAQGSWFTSLTLTGDSQHSVARGRRIRHARLLR